MTKVERTELAPGLHISRLLTGLWQVADMERERGPLNPVKAAEDMGRYVDAGFTTFDMADHYGSSEVIAGSCDQQRPGASEFLTKWVPKPGPITREAAREAVMRALERLGRDRIDLLQFHAWNYADPSYLDGLFHLQALKEEGLIHHLGVTNVDAAHLRVILHSGIDIASNQVCYSLIDRRARGEMTELCAHHGVRILAFGTLAGGFLTERWLGAPEPAMSDLTTWSQMKYKRFIDVSGGWAPFQELLRALKSTADGMQVSMANVATRAILEEPAVAGVIVGARLGERAHIEDNLRVFDCELDEVSQAALHEAVDRLRPVPGDCGDEYRKPPFLTASGDLSHHLEAFPPPFPSTSVAPGRTISLSGTEWESIAGFSRATRIGDRILVSGTTATHGSRRIGGDDPAAQATFCLDKIEGAIQSLGGRLEDIVKTRIYVADAELWEPIARAHGARFESIRPANTMVQAGLIGEGYLVEIEAEAIVDPPT